MAAKKKKATAKKKPAAKKRSSKKATAKKLAPVPANFMAPAHLLRAATKCIAKKDVREYLNWISVRQNGTIEACDGHIALSAAARDGHMFDLPDRDLLLRVNGKIDAKADECFFEFIDKQCGVVHTTSRSATNFKEQVLSFEIGECELSPEQQKDGQQTPYPDIDNLFKENFAAKRLSRIGFSGPVLNFVNKVYGSLCVAMEFHGVTSAVHITCANGPWQYYQNNLYLMPASLVESVDDAPLNGFGDDSYPNHDVPDSDSDSFELDKTPASDDRDELYSDAETIVIESRKASISYVQRRLKIGYNRAARIVEALEKSGIVSGVRGNGTRDVLV